MNTWFCEFDEAKNVYIWHMYSKLISLAKILALFVTNCTELKKLMSLFDTVSGLH